MENTEKKSRGRLWSWGTAIAYCLFAGGTIAFVIFASTQKVELVSDDYYKNEVVYQQQIERINRTNALEESIEWHISDDKKTLDFLFSLRLVKGGTITLYRPSSTTMDKKYTITAGDVVAQHIPLTGLERGMWRVKVNWYDNDGKSYYKEADLMLE
ncbi:MAG: FixH family protein [Ignavibacteriae bacterium]|nr:FixH family protein [Ignavibacteriota bacterium]